MRVVGNITHCWTQFAALLNPEKFTVSEISVIQNSNQRTSFDQAYKMMEDWRDELSVDAKCRLVVTAFLDMKMKRQACDVFGEALVKYVNKMYGSLV